MVEHEKYTVVDVNNQLMPPKNYTNGYLQNYGYTNPH